MIRQAIESAMVFYKGNKTAAAQSLGIAIRTLDTRLDKYRKEKEQHEKRIADAQQKRSDFQQRQRAMPTGAGFDNGSTPSVHDPRRSAGQSGQVGNVPGEGTRPKSVANLSAK